MVSNYKCDHLPAHTETFVLPDADYIRGLEQELDDLAGRISRLLDHHRKRKHGTPYRRPSKVNWTQHYLNTKQQAEDRNHGRQELRVRRAQFDVLSRYYDNLLFSNGGNAVGN